MITTVAGNGGRGFAGDGGAALDASLDRPRGLAFDAEDNLYIADVFNHRIRRIDARTAVITTVAGTGESGRNAGTFGGDGDLATEARLNLPLDVTVDAAGNLWIADFFNNRVRFVESGTGIITTVAGQRQVPPRGRRFPGTTGRRLRPRSSFLAQWCSTPTATSSSGPRPIGYARCEAP